MNRTTKPPAAQRPTLQPDHVCALAAWTPAAPGDRYTIYAVPARWRDAVEITKREARKTQDAVISYCLPIGVARLRALPGVATLIQAREMIQSAGDDHTLDAYGGWRYTIDTAGAGARKIFVNALCLEPGGPRSGELAQQLGLPRHVIDALAIAAVLVEVGPVPQVTRDHMNDQYVAFARRLRARAKLAMSAAVAVCTGRSDPAVRTYTYADVLAAIDTEEETD